MLKELRQKLIRREERWSRIFIKYRKTSDINVILRVDRAREYYKKIDRKLYNLYSKLCSNLNRRG